MVLTWNPTKQVLNSSPRCVSNFFCKDALLFLPLGSVDYLNGQSHIHNSYLNALKKPIGHVSYKCLVLGSLFSTLGLFGTYIPEVHRKLLKHRYHLVCFHFILYIFIYFIGNWFKNWPFLGYYNKCYMLI